MGTDNTKIAIAGHTNTGKTTLIRTLISSTVGEVDDKPNVTQKGQPFYYDGLQATFIDTPGFQHGALVSLYLESRRENPTFSLGPTRDEKIRYDLEAATALEDCHVVLYIVNLCQSPDQSFEEELDTIRSIQPRIIAILNQRNALIKQKAIEGTNRNQGVEARINLWTNVCVRQGVHSVFVFDAHWDNRQKMNEIYDGISSILTPEQRNIFKEGLAKFKKRQSEIRHDACLLLGEFVADCRATKASMVKSQYSEEQGKAELAKALKSPTDKFFAKVTKLYLIASEHPNASNDKIRILMSQTPDINARAKLVAFSVTLFGGGGAAIGAGIGAAIGALFGGIGALGGAAVGAKVGGVFGSMLGGLTISVDVDDKVVICLASDELRVWAALGLAVIWGLSNVGFGRARQLASGEIDRLFAKIMKDDLLPQNIDWTNTPIEECMVYFEHALDVLDSFEA